MVIQHSPPARQTRSQERTQAVITPTPRAPFAGTPAVPQMRAQLDRGPHLEGAAPSRKEGRGPRRSSSFSGVVGSFPGISRTIFKGPGEEGEEEEENCGEEKGLMVLKVFLLLLKDSKVLYATSFLICRAAEQIEPYLSNLTNQDPSYLLNFCQLFESKLFTLFGDKNEVRKAEAELDFLRMKEDGHFSLYIADFRSLVSRIGDWGERALIHHFRKGVPSRVLDQLASHHSRIYSLKDLMDITIEIDTRYNERQKGKKPEASKSNSSHPKNSSSSSQKKMKNFQKRDKPHSSLLKKDFNLMGFEKERRIKEGLFTYCGGNHSLESCFESPQKKLTPLSGRFPSQGKA
ncbi:hypothetical protein O181_067478 [Austropuccinia psidii MF-1]|uniref:Retrotransposon gag domain-containing protein n=1 Tax=Austropuccinia psidii MF-1 TaxID=1389203 RepID=A0A9Q3ETF5_9BASI|nr:hypothetical protein [Austropuccinia psidii MF-1]